MVNFPAYQLSIFNMLFIWVKSPESNRSFNVDVSADLYDLDFLSFVSENCVLPVSGDVDSGEYMIPLNYKLL